MGPAADPGYWSGEIWNRRRNGEVYPQLLTISAVRNPQGRTEQYVGCSPTSRSSRNSSTSWSIWRILIRSRACPTACCFPIACARPCVKAQRRSQQLAVVYLDLMVFKSVNDHHGHDVGDFLLVALGQRMKDALRDGDTLARMGGDEFVVVLIDLDHSTGSLPVLQRLLAAASEAVHHQGAVCRCPPAWVSPFYPQASEVDADQLLRQGRPGHVPGQGGGKNRYVVLRHRRTVADMQEGRSEPVVRFACAGVRPRRAKSAPAWWWPSTGSWAVGAGI